MTRIMRHKTQGFTLVSTLIALAIIGISVAVAGPALWEIGHEIKLKQAARQALTVMRSARYKAINEVRDYGILVRYDNRIQLFEGDDPTDALAVKQEFSLPGGISLDQVDSFTTNSDGGFVVFSADGSADSTGAFQLLNSNQHLIEIRLEPRRTARMRLRTWDAATSAWKENG